MVKKIKLDADVEIALNKRILNSKYKKGDYQREINNILRKALKI